MSIERWVSAWGGSASVGRWTGANGQHMRRRVNVVDVGASRGASACLDAVERAPFDQRPRLPAPPLAPSAIASIDAACRPPHPQPTSPRSPKRPRGRAGSGRGGGGRRGWRASKRGRRWQLKSREMPRAGSPEDPRQERDARAILFSVLCVWGCGMDLFVCLIVCWDVCFFYCWLTSFQFSTTNQGPPYDTRRQGPSGRPPTDTRRTQRAEPPELPHSKARRRRRQRQQQPWRRT